MLQRMVGSPALDAASADRAHDRYAGGARGLRAVRADADLRRARQHHGADAEIEHLAAPRVLPQHDVLPLVVILRVLTGYVVFQHAGLQQHKQRDLRRRPRTQQFHHAERQLDLLHVEARATRAVGLSVHEQVRLRGLRLPLEELRLRPCLEYAPWVELETLTALHALRLDSTRLDLTRLDLT